MNKKLRIVFMGTPEFAVATLAKLCENGYEVVGVITAPDRPAGRGRKLQGSAVKEYAERKGLKILQPTNLKNEQFLEELRSLRANLQIVVAFRMLPKTVWSMPEYGTFNLHASLLPDYRGAAPINWAIINGETKTGATTFFIDDKIDTGKIILQDECEITNDDTAGTLHDRLMDIGSKLVIKTVKAIERGNVEAKKQMPKGKLKQAHKIHRDTCEIDWNSSLNDIHNHVRGLSPYPTAWTTLVDGDNRSFLKIYKTVKCKEVHNLKIGSVIATKKELKVAVQNGFIELLEIQLPGKRRMKTNEVLNGLELSKSAHMS
ncbi:methionyl-tRNA formyltransferase [Maribacter algicola]|uniref:Methionyl-tRNA formyltransferase n=1 Tax=Meishania litoralis TaxID=3434685 RepID=A0ACC7LNW4_9FLAO